jgi:predicted SPOUT superfamily RNA methylase MTH1
MKPKQSNKFNIQIELDSDGQEEQTEKPKTETKKVPKKKPVKNKRVQFDYDQMDDEVQFVSIKNKRSKGIFISNKKPIKTRKIKKKVIRKVIKKKVQPSSEPTPNENQNEAILLPSEEQPKEPKPQEMKISNLQNKNIIICIPNSILSTGQTSELQADLLGKLARKLSLYKVSRIIILKDHSYNPRSTMFRPSQFILKILQYLETPQYLRKRLFPICNELRLAGLLAPLECPHHLKAGDISEYREGVVLKRPTKKNKGSFADIGLLKDCQLDRKLPPFTRVTVKLDDQGRLEYGAKNFNGKVVSIKEAVKGMGTFWGYEVEVQETVADVMDVLPANCFKVLIDDRDSPYSQEVRGKVIQDFNQSGFDNLFFMFGHKGLKHLTEHEMNTRVPANVIEAKFDATFGNWFNNMGILKLHLEEQVDFFLHQFLF